MKKFLVIALALFFNVTANIAQKISTIADYRIINGNVQKIERRVITTIVPGAIIPIPNGHTAEEVLESVSSNNLIIVRDTFWYEHTMPYATLQNSRQLLVWRGNEWESKEVKFAAPLNLQKGIFWLGTLCSLLLGLMLFQTRGFQMSIKGYLIFVNFFPLVFWIFPALLVKMPGLSFWDMISGTRTIWLSLALIYSLVGVITYRLSSKRIRLTHQPT
jgi:hypothetical protein